MAALQAPAALGEKVGQGMRIHLLANDWCSPAQLQIWP
jgi:hypothetical protein